MSEVPAININVAGVTKAANINVAAREIDFVTRFDRNWEALRTILGIMKPIKKAPGAVIKTKTVTGKLQDGEVEEGTAIPLSQFKVEETPVEEMDLKKYAKAVSLEAIKEHGYENAVALTDDEFLYQLQDEVTGTFYTFANNGSLHPAGTWSTFQSAMAMAKGAMVEKFKAMKKNVTNIVAFVNALDVYEYLGTAEITVQSAFGFQYLTNFMGYSTVVLLSSNEVKRGRVIATPVDNINLYYVDPSDSDFVRAGFDYVVSGETNLIGFHVGADYSTATTVNYAVMGMAMFAEYIDGIAVIDVGQTYA